jgi:hypothetical protein
LQDGTVPAAIAVDPVSSHDDQVRALSATALAKIGPDNGLKDKDRVKGLPA